MTKVYYTVKTKLDTYFGDLYPEYYSPTGTVKATQLFKTFEDAVQFAGYGDRVVKVLIKELEIYNEGIEKEPI